MWLKCSKYKRINFTCKCTLNSEEKGLIGVAVFPWEGILRPTGLLSYVQTDVTTSNIVGSCCVHLHVAKSLTGFIL